MALEIAVDTEDEVFPIMKNQSPFLR